MYPIYAYPHHLTHTQIIYTLTHTQIMYTHTHTRMRAWCSVYAADLMVVCSELRRT